MTNNDDLSKLDAEIELFKQTVGPIKALKPTNRVFSPKISKPFKLNRKKQRYYDPTSILDQKHSLSIHDSICLVKESLPSIPLKLLKQGKIMPTRSLDLHGLTSKAALKKLIAFTELMLHSREELGLVIHGKGNHSLETPVLKNIVYNFFTEISEVAALLTAHQKHGGLGASYVIFKTNC